jgi:hypothetical protein
MSSVSSISAQSLPQVVSRTSQGTDAVADVTLLKKAQDQMKQQGSAMVALLEAAGQSSGDRRGLDTYA